MVRIKIISYIVSYQISFINTFIVLNHYLIYNLTPFTIRIRFYWRHICLIIKYSFRQFVLLRFVQIELFLDTLQIKRYTMKIFVNIESLDDHFLNWTNRVIVYYPTKLVTIYYIKSICIKGLRMRKQRSTGDLDRKGVMQSLRYTF